MEHLLESRFTWSQFFIVAICLVLLYFLLNFSRQILTNKNYLGELRLPLLKGINRILLFYEPMVLLILVSIFVLIRPSLHGLWALLLIIGGFSHIKNYISGRILQLEQGITLGNQIKFDNQKGVISKIGRLGLQLKSGKGTHYLNYSRLMAEGFTQSSGEEVSGLHKLKVSPKANTAKKPLIRLKDLMISAPYLDWNYQPTYTPLAENTYQVRVMVREEGHLQDLLRLIEEWGYDCQTV